MSNTPKRVPDIGVVIITRNESANIASCLESIVSNSAGFDVEIFLVDSASTDLTVEIASRFPATIIRLDPSPLLSPSVGRFVGTRYVSAPVIQFLDGDMVMLPGWLEAAVHALEDKDIGGVAGLLHRSVPGNGDRTVKREITSTMTVECFGGAAMYKKVVLDRVGTFNPFMLGEEERELGYRIRREGLRLKRIPADMAIHMEKVQDHSEVNEKSRYFRGVGQLIRAYPFTPIFWRIIGLQRKEMQMQVMFWLLPLAAVILAIEGEPVGATVAACVMALFTAALVAWKGPRKVVLFAKRRVLIPWNIAKGFFIGIGRPEDFPETHTLEQAKATAPPPQASPI